MLPYALDGLIPSVRALNNIEEIEEERRLFYFACIRAKQDLLITMPSYHTRADFWSRSAGISSTINSNPALF